MTRICIIGYGKMGHMIHQLAPQKDCEVVSCIDPHQPNCFPEINLESLSGADVAIDFSHPSVAIANLEQLIQLKQNVVVGTTGWHSDLARISALASSDEIGLLYGANFSIGMNIFSHIVANAVKMIDLFEDYDLFALEKHHAQKADSPSGTAIELSKIILDNSSRKTQVVYDKLERKILPSEFHFASIRGGNVPGTHSLVFDSEADTIELNHIVRSRSTFALGALSAAKWLKGKKGIFSFNEMIKEILW